MGDVTGDTASDSDEIVREQKTSPDRGEEFERGGCRLRVDSTFACTLLQCQLKWVLSRVGPGGVRGGGQRAGGSLVGHS